MKKVLGYMAFVLSAFLWFVFISNMADVVSGILTSGSEGLVIVHAVFGFLALYGSGMSQDAGRALLK